MHKIGLIIAREYLTRVRKKSFIAMTFLGPLIFASIILVPIWLASSDISDEKVIGVIDESGLLANHFTNGRMVDGNLEYELIHSPLEDAKSDFSSQNRYGLLYLPDFDVNNPEGITFFSESNPSIVLSKSIEGMLEKNIKDIKLARSGIDKSTLDNLDAHVALKTINLLEGDEKKGNADVATLVGYVASFMIYGFIFLYGTQVMRGVIEEKTTRIVEIIISSVSPFQLLLGKIIGVALVGLTQLTLWLLLTFTISGIVMATLNVDQLTEATQTEIISKLPEAERERAEAAKKIKDVIDTVNIPLIVFSFVFYFLGGYLLYSAMFAAVGSAADTDTDYQQFTLPISAPLIFSIIILTAVLQDPDGKLAFWTSMIPLSSPIVMMMRIPFGVPVWQIVLSMSLLVGGFILTTWVAGRIYRVGILIHGSKVNYKTLGKWLFSNR